MNTLDDLRRRIEQYEVAITGHEGTATKQIEAIWSSTQPDIDAAQEIVRRQEAVIAETEADREARKRDILSIASRVTEPMRSLLADAKHQLAAISAPILRLPNECIAEIMAYFNVDNPMVVLLLVSKRWYTIAEATPRLWSKIVLCDGSHHQAFRLKEAHICKSLERLSLVLSLAKGVLLDIELACSPATFGGFPQNLMLPQNPVIDGDLMTGTSDTNRNWHDTALRLLGADGRSRRWRSFYVTWFGTNSAPFTVINGPFDNLKLLYIQPFCFGSTLPLVTTMVQKAPRLSAVYARDWSTLQQVQGWKDPSFWRKIESYHSLAVCDDWSFLSHASRLRDLSLSSWQSVSGSEPVFLPSLRTLRLLQSRPDALDGFRLPDLETLFLEGSIFGSMDDPIPVLSVTSIIYTNCMDVRILRRFLAPALYHLHLACPDYIGRRRRTKDWQNTFIETFNGSQFMPRPISLHLELPVSDFQLLSALFQLPQIEELKITPFHPLGSKFWAGLTPRGAGGRKKAKQYCTKLRIMVVEVKRRPYGTVQALSRARTVELGVGMAFAREQEGQIMTHLLFSWDDGSKDEVLGSFKTLPLHPSPDP